MSIGSSDSLCTTEEQGPLDSSERFPCFRTGSMRPSSTCLRSMHSTRQLLSSYPQTGDGTHRTTRRLRILQAAVVPRPDSHGRLALRQLPLLTKEITWERIRHTGCHGCCSSPFTYIIYLPFPASALTVTNGISVILRFVQPYGISVTSCRGEIGILLSGTS